MKIEQFSALLALLNNAFVDLLAKKRPMVIYQNTETFLALMTEILLKEESFSCKTLTALCLSKDDDIYISYRSLFKRYTEFMISKHIIRKTRNKRYIAYKVLCNNNQLETKKDKQ